MRGWIPNLTALRIKSLWMFPEHSRMRSVVAMPIPFDKVLRARISLIQPVIQQGDKTEADTDFSEFAHTK